MMQSLFRINVSEKSSIKVVWTLSVFLFSERSVRRITRALKNAVLQQQMINVDKALQILDQETPPLVVDRDKLKVRVIL